MPMPISTPTRIINGIDALEKAREIFNTMPSLNGQEFKVALPNKLVIEDENHYIVRIESPSEIIKRVLMYKYFEHQFGENNPFLREQYFYRMSNNYLGVSGQEKITLLEAKSDDEVFENFSDDVKNELKKLQVSQTFVKNWGKDENGKVKIFDYMANVAVRQEQNGTWSLLGKDWEVIYNARIN